MTGDGGAGARLLDAQDNAYGWDTSAYRALLTDATTSLRGRDGIHFTSPAVLLPPCVTTPGMRLRDGLSPGQGGAGVPAGATASADGRTQTVVVRDTVPLEKARARFMRLAVTRP